MRRFKNFSYLLVEKGLGYTSVESASLKKPKVQETDLALLLHGVAKLAHN